MVLKSIYRPLSYPLRNIKTLLKTLILGCTPAATSNAAAAAASLNKQRLGGRSKQSGQHLPGAGGA